jgi:two-component system cell cycle sensor histidine kinase/response regulator CckA
MSVLRVLIVEDSPTDAKLIQHTLRTEQRSVESERVEDPAGMTAALEKPWDLIICDWTLPKFSALSALNLVRERGLDVPFIIASGTIGEELAVTSMRAGANNYVLKDKLSRLLPAVERELGDARARAAHREAEQALGRQEARFRALIENSSDAITLTDQEGKLVYASPSIKRLLGYAPSDLVGTVARNMAHEGDLESFDAAMLSIRGPNADPVSLQFRAKHQDGSHRWLAGRFTNMLGDPAVDAIVGNLRDVTDRQHALENLRDTENQLRQSQKMEAVGRLAGGVAHDFNNLLSVVLTYSQFILDDLKPNDPMRADMAEVQKAGERAAELTKQLLMFSRQQVISPRVLNLNDLVRDMDKMLRRILGEGLELVVLPEPELAHVKVDRSSLEQVIMNLVINARDAMHDAGTITIETANVTVSEEHAHAHPGTKAGPHVLLSVTDTGTGMDMATQMRVFEPFFSTKGAGKGTGLGLSTVFGIIQQSSGSIEVESAIGRGTTFRIYLPRSEGAIESAGTMDMGDLRGHETVLLVEDEDQVRTVARTILRRQGYKVIEARNGGEALLSCEKHEGTIHLLLTDVVMPQMSGPELAKRLAPIKPEMKLLCMSGYTDNNIVRHGVLEAEIAFLQKPFTPESLARKVREVLGKQEPSSRFL